MNVMTKISDIFSANRPVPQHVHSEKLLQHLSKTKRKKKKKKKKFNLLVGDKNQRIRTQNKCKWNCTYIVEKTTEQNSKHSTSKVFLSSTQANKTYALQNKCALLNGKDDS